MLYAVWTQTVVLAITAGLIYWYIIETSGLRKQMVRQNEIALRPVIVPVFDNRGGEPIFKLKNIGVGVAFNVTVEPLIEVRLIEPGHELRHEFRFSRLSHLGSKQGGENGGWRKRCQEPFFGRPGFRIVIFNPNFPMAFDTHLSEPYGRLLWMAQRIFSTSSRPCERFSHST